MTQENDGNDESAAAMLAQALHVVNLLLQPRLELARQKHSPGMRASKKLCWRNHKGATFLCLCTTILIVSDRRLD